VDRQRGGEVAAGHAAGAERARHPGQRGGLGQVQHLVERVDVALEHETVGRGGLGIVHLVVLTRVGDLGAIRVQLQLAVHVAELIVRGRGLDVQDLESVGAREVGVDLVTGARAVEAHHVALAVIEAAGDALGRLGGDRQPVERLLGGLGRCGGRAGAADERERDQRRDGELSHGPPLVGFEVG
jgi:hypothetical protein